MSVDKQEIDALSGAIERFEAARIASGAFEEADIGIVQAARRIILILRMDKPSPPPQTAVETVVVKDTPRPTQAVPMPLSAHGVIQAKTASGRYPKQSPLKFTGDPCPECNMMMLVRTGTCLTCHGCGYNSGCG